MCAVTKNTSQHFTASQRISDSIRSAMLRQPTNEKRRTKNKHIDIDHCRRQFCVLSLATDRFRSTQFYAQSIGETDECIVPVHAGSCLYFYRDDTNTQQRRPNANTKQTQIRISNDHFFFNLLFQVPHTKHELCMVLVCRDVVREFRIEK